MGNNKKDCWCHKREKRKDGKMRRELSKIHDSRTKKEIHVRRITFHICWFKAIQKVEWIKVRISFHIYLYTSLSDLFQPTRPSSCIQPDKQPSIQQHIQTMTAESDSKRRVRFIPSCFWLWIIMSVLLNISQNHHLIALFPNNNKRYRQRNCNTGILFLRCRGK